MRSENLLDNLGFHQSVPFAQPLMVRDDARISRWMLKPGQTITEHTVPQSSFCVVVLNGRGMFCANGDKEQEFGPNSLLIFDTGETHTVGALDEVLVFIGFLQGTADIRPDRVGRNKVGVYQGCRVFLCDSWCLCRSEGGASKRSNTVVGVGTGVIQETKWSLGTCPHLPPIYKRTSN